MSANAQGMKIIPHTPGIWTNEQVEAWRTIVDAVHAKRVYSSASYGMLAEHLTWVCLSFVF
jgi:2,4-dienoyl-CoA reductase-like NADH-dependent reductase (Old Yellow Enzyme family)